LESERSDSGSERSAPAAARQSRASVGRFGFLGIGGFAERGPGVLIAAKIGTTSQTGGHDLIVSADVGLREFEFLAGTGYLAFMTLGESLIHLITSGSDVRHRRRRCDFPWAWLR
jgi:hypothetical protein